MITVGGGVDRRGFEMKHARVIGGRENDVALFIVKSKVGCDARANEVVGAREVCRPARDVCAPRRLRWGGHEGEDAEGGKHAGKWTQGKEKETLHRLLLRSAVHLKWTAVGARTERADVAVASESLHRNPRILAVDPRVGLHEPLGEAAGLR